MQEVDFLGYKILEDGTIIGLNGKPMAYNKTIQLTTDKNKTQSFSYARLVYWAFHQDFDFNNHKFCVRHKDSDETNNNINNLYISDKKDYLWGENHKKSKLTEEEVEEIRKLYFIGEEDNKGNGLNNPKRKYSYRKLAEKFGVSHNLIKQIVKGECRNNG